MRSVLAGFIVAAVLGAGASSASASILAGDTVTLGWPTFANHGNEGPFQMTKKDGSESILTFCVETNRYFSPGSQYFVESTGLVTREQGFQLSGYTAWIYAMFRQDNGWHLPSAFSQDQTKMGTEEYNVLQYAIWAGMILPNVTPSHDSVGHSVATAEQVFGSINGYLGKGWTEAELHNNYGIGLDDFEKSNWGGSNITIAERYLYTGNVVVLNLTDTVNHNADNQDQLGLSNAPMFRGDTPEPASLIVWSSISLFGCLGYWRRKRVVAKQQELSSAL
jgi:hypothetical protein